MIWSFVNTGEHAGSFNMAFDEQLAQRLRDGIGVPTVRVYGWKPHAISLGFNQSADAFDDEAMWNAGIDLVRRPTGGQAILHANELTYSIVLPVDGRGPREIYRLIGEGLLAGLDYLGVKAELSAQDDALPRNSSDPGSIPCFTRSAKCEIQWQGRKLIGSAQRRYGSIVLQHGSLLLGPEHRRIVEFLAREIKDAQQPLNDLLGNRTTDVSTILDRPVSFNETAAAIRKGFETAWGIEFTPVRLEDEVGA